MVRAIGADRVVDYTREDFTRGGQRYDLIYDLVSNHSFATYRRVLSPHGAVVPAGGGGSDGRQFGRRLARMLIGTLVARFARQRMIWRMTRRNLADLDTL